MATDTIVMLSVFGGLFLVNLISLILVYVTPYGKSWIFENMTDEGKGFFIFWNFFMLICGICFWVASLVEVIRYGRRKYDEWKNVSIKELIRRLNEEWNKKK